MKSTMTTLALMGLASAQTSVVTLMLDGYDQEPLYGSIVGSDKAGATTYSITCAPDTTSTAKAISTSTWGSDDSYGYDYGNDCGVPSGFMFTQGPSTMAYSYVYSGSEYDDGMGLETGYDTATEWDTATDTNTASATLVSVAETEIIACVLTPPSTTATATSTTPGTTLSGWYVPAGPATPAACTASDIEVYGTTSSTSTTETSMSDIRTVFAGVNVTITAGLSGSGSGSSSGAAKITGSGKPGAAGASVSGSEVSTAGMPMVTAKAQYLIGGAVAVVAVVAGL